MGSLNSAVSGLSAHQTLLDVIGNNIANLNTTGYKTQRVAFADILSQTLSAGTAATDSTGGTNPTQVGLGVRVGNITTQFSQGGLTSTDSATDLAIQGDGFFVVANGDVDYYTRAGNFTLDSNGYLVDGTTGYRVQGVDGDIQISMSTSIPPQVTSQADLSGNLDADAATSDTCTSSFTVYDSLGASHTLTATFTKTANANEWTYAVTSADTNVTIASGSTGTIVFTSAGVISSGGTGALTLNYATGAADAQAVTVNFGETDNSTGLTGYSNDSSVAMAYQNGYTSGTLESYSLGSDGSITGTFSNGLTSKLGNLVLATFNNPSGLLKCANNMYTESANSGSAVVDTPGSGSSGTISSSTLESSNVDLASEFTQLIVAQRGYQANARVITTTDELLNEAVNLKR